MATIEPQPPGPACTDRIRLLSLRQVTAVGLVAFSLFALLDAPALRRLARRQPIDWWRTVEVGAADRLVDLSHLLRLDRARLAADRALGRHFGTAHAFEQLAVDDAGSMCERDPSMLRQASPRHPLKLWIIGDSQARMLGEALVARATASERMQATLDAHIASGLSRPDYFDWPGAIKRLVEHDHPDAMVVVFGANDLQAIELDTGFLRPGDAEWNAEYARRTDLVMAYLERHGVRVYWIGQPAGRRPVYSRRMADLNAIFAERAQPYANTTFISLFDLFLGADGRYADDLPDAGGAVVQMRTNDGIHLTRAGAERAADVIFARIAADLP